MIELIERIFHIGRYGRLFGASKPRSAQWAALSAAYRKEQPLCEFGMHKPTILIPLNTHHLVPFHVNPALELIKSNWMNVCRFHHFWHCHFGNWASWNVDAREDGKTFTDKVKNRPVDK